MVDVSVAFVWLPLALMPLALMLASCGESSSSNLSGNEKGDSGSPNEGDGGVLTAGSAGSHSGIAPPPGSSKEGWVMDYQGSQGAICASDIETDFSKLSQVKIGETTLYVGFEQTSAVNQDPIFARFDSGKKVYCRYHENDGPDGRALALTWDGGEYAYVVYTVVGGGTDLEGKGGWLSSYAPGTLSGGNKTVSVLGRVKIESGEVDAATFFMAKLTSGKLNSQSPVEKDLAIAPVTVLEDGNIEFRGSSAHQPIDADGKSEMNCTDYPFTTKYVLSADLSTLICAESTNCTSMKPCD